MTITFSLPSSHSHYSSTSASYSSLLPFWSNKDQSVPTTAPRSLVWIQMFISCCYSGVSEFNTWLFVPNAGCLVVTARTLTIHNFFLLAAYHLAAGPGLFTDAAMESQNCALAWVLDYTAVLKITTLSQPLLPVFNQPLLPMLSQPLQPLLPMLSQPLQPLLPMLSQPLQPLLPVFSQPLLPVSQQLVCFSL